MTSIVLLYTKLNETFCFEFIPKVLEISARKLSGQMAENRNRVYKPRAWSHRKRELFNGNKTGSQL